MTTDEKLRAENDKLRALLKQANDRADRAEQQLPPPESYRELKRIVPESITYESARDWCERHLVPARKVGGRWWAHGPSLLARAKWLRER